MITKIKLTNYKKFDFKEIIFNNKKNILVGENGVGKTSILEAIDLVLSGSFSKIEKYGLQSLFNVQSIKKFMNSKKNYDELPKLIVEIYISDDIINHDINGVHHQENNNIEKNGLFLEIFPNEEYSKTIKELLENTDVFPFEYYTVKFKTFSGTIYNSYNKYKKFINHSFLRNDVLSNQFKMREYIDIMFEDTITLDKRRELNNLYRNDSENFIKKLYEENHVPPDLELGFDHSSIDALQKNITIYDSGVDISNKGHGERLLLNTEVRIKKSKSFDILLIEEPENYLSYLNMHKLIKLLTSNENTAQFFISTHSNMISSRLDIKNAILVSENNSSSLQAVDEETTNFFIKAPNTNLLNFILAKKAILVEGDAEYILMSKFYEKVNNSNEISDSVTIISCGGKTFKRYLNLAKVLENKVAVITDNDENYTKNIESSFSDMNDYQNIKIFSDNNNERYTFEVCIFKDNEKLLEEKLKTTAMINGVLSFMLNNKAESALRILNLIEDGDNLIVPRYIVEALKWIKE